MPLKLKSTPTAAAQRGGVPPRGWILAPLALGLMLILPAHLLADEIVYFTNGKAMTVKKVEKGDRFTILEVEGGGRVGVPNDRIVRIEAFEGSRPATPLGGGSRLAAAPVQTGQPDDQSGRMVPTRATPAVSPTGVVNLDALRGANKGPLPQTSASGRNMDRRLPPRATGQNMRGAGPNGRLNPPGGSRFGYGGDRGRTGRTNERNLRGRPNFRGNPGMKDPRKVPAQDAAQSAAQNPPKNGNDATSSDESTSEEN